MNSSSIYILGNFSTNDETFKYIVDSNSRHCTEDCHLCKGGLKIPCEVKVKMELHDRNLQAIDELKRLVDNNYKEPIDDNFPDATKQILEQLQSPSDELSEDTDSTDEEAL